MRIKKSAYGVSFLVLLFLSLIATASTAGTTAQAGARSQQLTVYIDGLRTETGAATLTADELEWYEGAAADAEFARQEPDAAAELGGAPDGYYIVNDFEQLAQYPIADDCKVVMQIYDHTGNPEDLDIQWNEEISLQKFGELYHSTSVLNLGDFPYHLTIEDGQVVKIVQQYIP